MPARVILAGVFDFYPFKKMHDYLFSNSVSPDPSFILNLRMLPYSIGHEILLQKSKNALVAYMPESLIELPERFRNEAIANAVLICSKTWRENKKPEKWIRLWVWRNRKKNFLEEIGKFLTYRHSGSVDFPTKDQPKVSGANYHYFGSPEAARLILFVAPIFSSLGFQSPYDFPFGLARQLYQASLESEGHLWVKNYFDMQDEARMKEYEKQHPESEFAMGAEAVKRQAEQWNLAHPECPVEIPN